MKSHGEVQHDSQKRASELADRVMTDIRRRDLVPGDRYFTTSQIGRMLGVSKAAANAAMQLLAQRRVVVRRRRSGTYIGQGVGSGAAAASGFDLIHVVGASSRTFDATQVIDGIQSRLRGVPIQFSFLPELRATDFLADLVEADSNSAKKIGHLLVSCSHEVQRFFASNHLYAAVIGGVYRDCRVLPSVSADASAAGRLLVDYLVATKGHEKIAFLTYPHWRPGDNQFFDGIGIGLFAAGLKHDSLVVRSVPSDRVVIGLEVQALMEGPRPPTAFICRSGGLADCVVRAIKTTSVCRIPEVVFGWETELSGTTEHSHTYVRVQSEFEQHVAVATGLLKDFMSGLLDNHRSVVLPVELVVSGGTEH